MFCFGCGLRRRTSFQSVRCDWQSRKSACPWQDLCVVPRRAASLAYACWTTRSRISKKYTPTYHLEWVSVQFIHSKWPPRFSLSLSRRILRTPSSSAILYYLFVLLSLFSRIFSPDSYRKMIRRQTQCWNEVKWCAARAGQSEEGRSQPLFWLSTMRGTFYGMGNMDQEIDGTGDSLEIGKLILIMWICSNRD